MSFSLRSLLALTIAPAVASAQPTGGFRSSLVITVSSVPVTTGLDCRRLELKWRPHPDATRYVVLLATARDGPWTTLPARNECGESRVAGATGLLDLEPLDGTRAGRRLFYRVAALVGTRAIDTTDVITIDLKPVR